MATTETRLASVDDAAEVARLLHDFNTEFDTPSPGAAELTPRLEHLLAEPSTVAILAGRPGVGVGLVTLRPNVWFDGLVALLDELYVVPELRGQAIGTAIIDRLVRLGDERGVDLVEINVDAGDVDAQRFYERHGFTGRDPDTGERAYYYSRELSS